MFSEIEPCLLHSPVRKHSHGLRKFTKACFSSVRLIYSHSVLNNIISNRRGMNAHFLWH